MIMGELVHMDAAEWDLDAIVRGCSGTGTAFSGENSGGFSQFDVPQEMDLFFESEATHLDELGELYKPFYPYPTEAILTSSVSVTYEIPKCVGKETKEQKLDCLQSNGSDQLNQNSDSKRKKSKRNQQKRVVQQVKEESLTSDVWAWRKYGQKPIKGSPYPRSYYRCSSSKGCLARKHVERNPLNPEIFIVTYTNEHKHGLPTRKHSLSGSTRAKPSQTKSSLTEKPRNQKVITSSTSYYNPAITTADGFSSISIQEKGIVEVNSDREVEGVRNILSSPDLMAEIEIFPDLAGELDELLKREEFNFDGCILDY